MKCWITGCANPPINSSAKNCGYISNLNKKNYSEMHAVYTYYSCYYFPFLCYWQIFMALLQASQLPKRELLQIVGASWMHSDTRNQYVTGTAVRGPFSIVGGLPTPYRTPILRHLCTLQKCWWDSRTSGKNVNVKVEHLYRAPSKDTATSEALRYMARTKQHRTYLPYTFPAVAGTHLQTPRGWRVE